ncbi:MAG: hypothetical protein PVH17_00675 [Anaerolineae bacterium]|jgi:hypothetical protein
MRTAVIIFVALLILFRWLHLILALEIATNGRQIQLRTEELHKYERLNLAIQREIAEAESPRQLADRALSLGYRPHKPIYLRISKPLAQPKAELGSRAEAATASARGALFQNLDSWSEARSEP